MATSSEIADAIKSIPEKKANLKRAFEALQSHSSFLSSFPLQWRDLDAHFSALESSINAHFKELPTSDDSNSAPNPQPLSELQSLCASMNATGLRSFLGAHREELGSIRGELPSALRFASDAAKLVLDVMDGFYSPITDGSKSKSKARKEKDCGDVQFNRGVCIDLLEAVYKVKAEVKGEVRERAKRVVMEWKGKIPKTGYYALETMGLLQLVVSYGLVGEFAVEEILEQLVSISRRRQAVELVRSLGFVDKLPDLIQKLNSKGRQLDAVKLVFAFNLMDKFPPVPLLKAYITESKKIAEEILKQGNNSLKSQNEATAKEAGALSSVLKAVEEYKLESQYPREQLEKRIAQLEKKKSNKKRTAAAPPASNQKNHHHSKPHQQQPQSQSNKRPRPSPASTSAANPYPTLGHPQPQLGLGGERTPYMGIGGPSLPTTGSVYNHASLSFPGLMASHGGIRSPPRSHVYSVESLAGYPAYGRYPLPGQPSANGSSLYP